MSDASLGTGDPFTPPCAPPDTVAQDVLARVNAVLPQAGGPHPLHAPEIDGNVFIQPNSDVQAGDFIQVKIDDADEYDLYGALAS